MLIRLIDQKKGGEAMVCAKQIVAKLENQNRKTLDLLLLLHEGPRVVGAAGLQQDHAAQQAQDSHLEE